MSEAATKPDIVVGVDGSDESFAALKWALEEASLTGQSVNAVFGWTHSWDMGSEPDSDEAWAKVRHDIANELRVWVDKAAAGIDFDPANLKLTSVKASGTSALLQIGHDSQQIVVGRRSLSRMARWFMGSLSASLAEAAEVPVTVVRIAGSEDETVTDAIANAPDSGRQARSLHAASAGGRGGSPPGGGWCGWFRDFPPRVRFRTGRSTTARRAAACDVLLAAQGFGRYSGL